MVHKALARNDPDGALLHRLDRLKPRSQLLAVSLASTQILKDVCGDFGWGDTPRPSLKQGDAQFLLEQRDLPGNHRRRGVESVGGSPYRTVLVHRLKIPQALLIELAHASSVVARWAPKSHSNCS